MDGVMNSLQSYYWYSNMLGHKEDCWVDYKSSQNSTFTGYETQLCPLACSNLKNILDIYSDIKIVISSTWRKSRDFGWFNHLFKYFKIFEEDKVIGKTPILNLERGYEIQHWLNNFEEDINDFVILDDDGDMGPYCDTNHFIQTDGKVGFDYRKMEEVDKHFGGFNLSFEELKEKTPYLMYSKPRDILYYKTAEGMCYITEKGCLSNPAFFYKKSELFAEVKE